MKEQPSDLNSLGLNPSRPGRYGVVLAAAGSGARFGARKQLLEIAGRPILHLSFDVFACVDEVQELVVVGPADDLSPIRELVASWTCPIGVELSIEVTAGGSSRQESVGLGLEALSPDVDAVLVHDAARPLVTRDEVQRMVATIAEHGAAVLGFPATDSIKEVEGPSVVRDLDRSRIWQVQTPQGARRELFEQAYAASTSGQHTDEVSLLQAAGIPVAVVEGSRDNMKVTLPGDLELAEFLLRRLQADP